MINIVEEQKKRIRHLYSFMFRRYRTNTLADGGSIRSESITTDYLKMAQNNRMDKSIRFGWLGEAGSKIASGRVEKLYDINCFEQLGSELVTNGDFSSSTGWVLESGFSIENNTLVGNNATGAAYKILSGTPPLTYYKITYTIVSITQGSVRALRGTNFGTPRTTVGTYTDYIGITATAGQDGTGLVTTGFSGVIDNISAKQVLNATNTNNATQTTPGSRPYITGNIAPNEKLGLKNPNGGSNFMTHPTISFAANESWSVTTVLNWNGDDTSNHYYIGSTNSGIGIRNSSVNKIRLRTESGNSSPSANYSTSGLIGKNKIITAVSIGNGIVSFYVDGVFVEDTNLGSNLSFNVINHGATVGGTASINEGQIKSHIIRSQALTQAQVTAEYTYLRSVYPEMESVVIGTQEWTTSNCEMAATPMGNVIANVTDNTIWASSQTLYTNKYDERILAGDTVEQATYAAVKASAFWCHYNNSVDNGAIYGKLYNWFAVKLLQMDIDKYNTDNPTALWGWRVPTQADFQTLSTYLGGDAVSGGKLKMTGTTYWNSPNTGADNSSGFSALAGGARLGTDGSFIVNLSNSDTSTITENGVNAYRIELSKDNTTLSTADRVKTNGYTLRFIKA